MNAIRGVGDDSVLDSIIGNGVGDDDDDDLDFDKMSDASSPDDEK